MSRAFTERAAFIASLTLAGFAAAGAAQSQTAPPTRVTIKGRDGEVWIERTEKSSRKGVFSENASFGGVVGEAIQMKTKGADDQAVVSYLRRHRSELPEVIDVMAARQLHRAGAGQPVMAYLATESAIDIGETGEGSGGQVVVEQAQPEPQYGYGAAYGYPGGYGSGIYARRPVRIIRRPVQHPVFRMPSSMGSRFPG